jgi:hypothetical protein
MERAHALIPVVETSQPSAVRFAARDLAARLGFDEADSYRAASWPPSWRRIS